MPDSFDYTTGTNSENVRLLQALIDDAPEYTEETNSRNANILKSIINNTEYTDAPQSEIEELLLRLKAKIGGEIEVDELNVTENGTYDAGVNKAYNPVTVELPLDSKTLTANGTYTASDDNLAGYDEVTVAVEGYAKKSIANTPTPIATFNASALPMPSLTVGIEATQDLHGYDNPWVGGAGKNKFDIEGWLNRSGATYTKSGNTYTITATSALFTTPFTFSDTDVTLSASTSSYVAGTATVIRMQLLDSNNNVVDELVANNSYQKREGLVASKVRFNWSQGGTFTITEPQIELSSTATSFAPYSNICPFSGWDEVNVTRCGKNLFGGTYDNIYSLYIPKGTQITLSTKAPQVPYSRFAIYDKDQNMIDYWAINYVDSETGRYYRTFTFSVDVYYVEFYYSPCEEMQIKFETDVTYEAYKGTTYTTQLKDGQGNPLTCYGGELSNENGVQTLTVTHGYIASYNGETLPSTWISDRDVYAEGTTPSTGAEVVYELATPQTIPQDNLAIASQDGTNNLWADSGDVLSGEYMEAL